MIRCQGCGEAFAEENGPVHAYVPSAPACWRTFGEVQADEMLRFGYPPAHRLVVDAYMAQHPGDGTDRRDRQSVFVHLLGLCAALERGAPDIQTRGVLARATRHVDEFPLLEREGQGNLTVTHMLGAADLEDYGRRSREWAAAVWASWAPEHDRIRSALDAVERG